jgi:uncharacterized lipoprotein YddW (UPF0748 family)
LDWPANKALTPTDTHRQKAELTNMLDKLKTANFNTILLQTRIRGTVIYPSAYEPISSVFTGKTNGYPGYDPLAFAIEECHKRGLECHAWIVTIPIGGQKQMNETGMESVARKYPSICLSYNGEWYLNPAHPQTKEYLMKLVHEIVEKYDIDGVHFDYLRYPEYIRNSFDSRDYQKYGHGKQLGQWRRDNITNILRYLHKGIKDLKPWVKVSSSPLGRYDNTPQYPSKNWNSYHTAYQDVELWLKEGLQDQVYPMMYFRGTGFYSFALDWKERSNGRQIVPGLGIYLLDPKEMNWRREDIETQLHFIRSNSLDGAAYYRAKYLTDNVKGLHNELSNKYYATPALIPPVPWLDNIPPTSPSQLIVTDAVSGYIRLNWDKAFDNDARNAPFYVVYASDEYPVDTSRPENIVAQRIYETNYTYILTYSQKRKEYFAVTAMDRYGNESEAIQFTSNIWEVPGR